MTLNFIHCDKRLQQLPRLIAGTVTSFGSPEASGVNDTEVNPPTAPPPPHHRLLHLRLLR